MKVIFLHIYILLLFFSFNDLIFGEYDGKGEFWQITDIHWDQMFSQHGDKSNMCHESLKNLNITLGYFGDYLCDSPYNLVLSSIEAMKKLKPQAEFILWTGDNAPHTKNLNFTVIFRTIKNITDAIRNMYEDKMSLVPVLGNHDAFPKDFYPSDGSKFYERYLDEGGWDRVIPVNGRITFKKGGYYTFPIRHNIKIMILNTNLYYRYNKLGQGLKDPGGQFEWMEDEFKRAKSDGKKFIVTAHAPPGYWERNALEPFFNDSYNDVYVDLMNNYSDLILAQIYGHEHTDSFRIFGADDPVGVAFLAPSVTPWFPTRLAGGTAINPSLRLFSFDFSSVNDYIQYHMNLTEANNASRSCVSLKLETCKLPLEDLWKVYYKASEMFSVNSLQPQNLNRYYESLSSNDTIFQKHFLLNSAGIVHGYCNATCKKTHLCAIRHQKRTFLNECIGGLLVRNTSSVPSSPIVAVEMQTTSLHPSIVIDHPKSLPPRWVFGFGIGVVVVTIVAVLFILTGKRRRKFFPVEDDGINIDGYRRLRTEAD